MSLAASASRSISSKWACAHQPLVPAAANPSGRSSPDVVAQRHDKADRVIENHSVENLSDPALPAGCLRVLERAHPEIAQLLDAPRAEDIKPVAQQIERYDIDEFWVCEVGLPSRRNCSVRCRAAFL